MLQFVIISSMFAAMDEPVWDPQSSSGCRARLWTVSTQSAINLLQKVDRRVVQEVTTCRPPLFYVNGFTRATIFCIHWDERLNTWLFILLYARLDLFQAYFKPFTVSAGRFRDQLGCICCICQTAAHFISNNETQWRSVSTTFPLSDLIQCRSLSPYCSPSHLLFRWLTATEKDIATILQLLSVLPICNICIPQKTGSQNLLSSPKKPSGLKWKQIQETKTTKGQYYYEMPPVILSQSSEVWSGPGELCVDPADAPAALTVNWQIKQAEGLAPYQRRFKKSF